jgi:hypothetical protein
LHDRFIAKIVRLAMSWLRIFAALLCITLTSHAASASDWTIVALRGAGRAFADGEWTALHVGDTLPRGGELRTEAGARLLAGGDGDILSVAPGARFDVEADADRSLVRVFDGEIQVAERDERDKRFIVMTSAAALVAKGAEFGVVADSNGAVVTVRRGLVLATDLATRQTIEIRAGQTYRARLGHAQTVEITAGADPAPRAPEGAAAGSAADGTASPAGASTSAEAKAGELDRVATGAIPAGAKGDARLAEEAADAVHEQRRKAKLGKADPRAVAAAERIESELFRDIDVETEPWDDDFQWTEMEHGEVRLKPITRIVLGLKGAESFEFWVLSLLVCLILGGLANAVLQETGFGPLFNATLVMTAFAAAIVLRDLYCRAGSNLALEPFMSMGMMMTAMPVMLLSGAFAKMRLRL